MAIQPALAGDESNVGVVGAKLEGSFDLRGFGSVRVSIQRFEGPGGADSWALFQARDDVHATRIASKYLQDLLSFGDLRVRPGDGLPGVVLELQDTGLWLLGLDGARCHVLFARSVERLTRLVQRIGTAGWRAVPRRAYPRWLDCFDNAGTGFYFGAGGGAVDLDADLAWLKQRGFSLCMSWADESRYVAPGVLDTSISDWTRRVCADLDIPYRSLLWPSRPRWIWNRHPLPHIQPAPGFALVNPWPEYQKLAVYSSFEPVPASDGYVFDARRRFAQSLEDDPNLLGHMASNEMPGAGILELSVVAGMPEVQEKWRDYLRSRIGPDVHRVGLLHKGREDAYRDWSQVRVPAPEDFMGFDERCVDLRGPWLGRADPSRQGVAEKWYLPEALSQGAWVQVDCNDPALMIYSPSLFDTAPGYADYWLARSIELTPGQAAELKYLHISRSNWQGLKLRQFDAYLNGKPLAPRTKGGRDEIGMCYDLGDAVRAGSNTLTINTHGNPAPGYIFLGCTSLRPYPYMSESENRLWYDAVEFSARLRTESLERMLITLRAGDANRPLKIAATPNLLDLTQDLCERYGAYQHDTGAASGTWTPNSGARVSRAHGLPWSSEPGGQAASAANMRQFVTLYLLNGTDAVDLFPSVDLYRGNPAVAGWIDTNLPLMHCIGKMDLPIPKLAVLRSARASRMGLSEPSGWDLSRGPLPATGRSFVNIDLPDLETGIAGRFPVVMDAGTVLMTQQDVEGIERYVRGGGTFIAQHHTGRHSPAKPDDWALARAFGLKISPRLMTDEHFGRWPLGVMIFAQDQELFPALRGQRFRGSGVSLEMAEALGESVDAVVRWEDGGLAIAQVRRGKGKIVFLGTPFYARLMDDKGAWLAPGQRRQMLGQMLEALGVWPEARTDQPDVWAQHWTSKNGVYDLYAVAHVSRQAQSPVEAGAWVRRESSIGRVVELSSVGREARQVDWSDGWLTLPPASYEPMQIRIFAAPREDGELSAWHWWDVQRRHWRALPPIPADLRPAVVATPPDVLPLAEGWQICSSTAKDDLRWIEPGFEDHSRRETRLGALAVMDLPVDGPARLRKTVQIPPSWKGCRVSLTFDAMDWFFGIRESGRLWIDGNPAPIGQPLRPVPYAAFTIDVTDQAADGQLTLALEIDGRQADPAKPRDRPAGATGLFYLQSDPAARAITPLAGPWVACGDVNVGDAVSVGDSAQYVYLETRFTLPDPWPAQRLFLESPQHLGWIILNGKVISTPAWMRTLDVSRLVVRDGQNVLRWVPGSSLPPRKIAALPRRPVPPLSLAWRKGDATPSP